MTNKTLNHLNKLLQRSYPIKLNKFHMIESGDQSVLEELWPALLIIAKKYTSEMVRQEIINAAKEHREGDVCDPEWSYNSAKSNYFKNSGIPWSATKRMWDLARVEIDAAIAANNKQRLNEYEAYRKACEQGVAVEPM